KVSLIDFNRSGCVLIEVVTEPVFHETSEVIDFVKELQLIARYLDVGDCDMEKGRMRLEANVSMSQDGSLPNYKVELKNINSFRFLEKAINAELVRQEKALKNGEVLVQETRGYDEVKQTTYSQRTKSEANDYRYFPEADLPPVRFDEKEVEKIKGDLPELPAEKRKIFLDRYKIASDFIEILVSDKSRADYFEESVKLGQEASLSPKVIADLMINKKLDSEYPEPAGLVRKIAELTKVEYASNDDLEKAVKSVVTENEKAVKDYKEGNGNVIGFLIGMVQKKLQGKGNAQLVRAKLLENLQS
ncbi:MAG TPA: hypothetical protein VKC54_03340, partial [Patescibacteria group bacterium]|nr:hypothetical protein [Patescibacteria group bacterium]